MIWLNSIRIEKVKQMTILSIGNSSFDITCPIEDYPVEGTKYLLNEKIELNNIESIWISDKNWSMSWIVWSNIFLSEKFNIKKK